MQELFRDISEFGKLISRKAIWKKITICRLGHLHWEASGYDVHRLGRALAQRQ